MSGSNGRYAEFLGRKGSRQQSVGFEPLWMPDWPFDFQQHLIDWSIRIGRGAVYADCGLGKGPMQLVWAENMLRKWNRPVMIFAPLSVSHQFVREGEKFGIDVKRTSDGEVHPGINVTNYERMGKYDPADFCAASGDESGVIKHYDSKTRGLVTGFMEQLDYRLLCTATPAPNDFMELGTSAEALGVMDRNRMLGMFFSHRGDKTQAWELKGHAKRAFWRWVASWARALRRPSDLGFEDGDYDLPPLSIQKHEIETARKGRGFFNYAVTREEQLAERRESLRGRCERAAELVPVGRPCVIWCHLNDEGDLLEKLIPDAVQVAGRHSDDEKEERLRAFGEGQIRVLVTKPKIGGWGLNWQHCSDVICFPTHSYESFYQTVRRCWRFGQKRKVVVNVVMTEAEAPVMKNMMRKERQAIDMFESIVREMRDYQAVVHNRGDGFNEELEVPAWL